MSFNEFNSVEHYIVHKISGENLNESGVSEPEETYGKFWKYKSAKELERSVNEVLLEEELKKALKRL